MPFTPDDNDILRYEGTITGDAAAASDENFGTISTLISNIENEALVDGGTVTVVPAGTGNVAYYADAADIANNATGTISYTVPEGQTLFVKGVSASSSGAPCKVVVTGTVSGTTTTYGTKFYSTASPSVDLPFFQPVPIPAGGVVTVSIENWAGAAQDVYATIFGWQEAA